MKTLVLVALSICIAGEAKAQLEGADVRSLDVQQLNVPRHVYPQTGAATTYIDNRVYNWPAFGRIKFVERKDINRNIIRKRVDFTTLEDEKEKEKKGGGGKLRKLLRFRKGRG